MITVFYKRLESFRYTFGAPPEITMKIKNASGDLIIYSLLLDISPKGAKVYTEKEIEVVDEIVRLKFILNHEIIIVDAKIAWKKQYEEGWLYGVDFERNPIKEMLIFNEIRELKEIEMH